MKLLQYFPILLLLLSLSAYSQSFSYYETFDWDTQELDLYHNGKTHTVYTFQQGYLSEKHIEVAAYGKQLNISGDQSVEIDVIVESTSPIEIADKDTKALISERITPWHKVIQNKNEYKLLIGFIPVIKTASGYEKIEKARINYILGEAKAQLRGGPSFSSSSKLADGQLYKVSINKSGVYKIDKNFLRDAGFDVDNLDPKKISILTHQGKAVVENLSESRIDDWVDTPILAIGDTDGKLDDQDYFLFYADGAESWEYSNDEYVFHKNIYSDNAYAIIKLGSIDGKRILAASQPNNVEFITDAYQSLQRYEADNTNLLGAFSATQGTGQLWLGDRFNSVRERSYNNEFDLSGIIPTLNSRIEMGYAVRCNKTSRVYLDISNTTLDESTSSTNISSQPSTSTYARYDKLEEDMPITTGNAPLMIRYPDQSSGPTGESQMWLDYLQIIAPKELNYAAKPLLISNPETSQYGSSAFEITGQPQHIWNITNTDNIQSYTIQNNRLNFATGNVLQEFYAFDENDALTPTKVGTLENQNIHSLSSADMIVVYHKSFADGIDRYIEHRSSKNGINIMALSTEEVYNEFSGGKLDPGAIRDLAKMLYDRDDKFRYLLLVGDGSYDYRNLVPDLDDHNFVPVYETKESLDPIHGFPTDDFFALLDNSEGTSLVGQIDISVGRMPVKTLAEFNAVVDKLIHYESSNSTLGDWRMKIGFASDDEDSNTHLDDTEEIAAETQEKSPQFNQLKTYFDAFVQESTPGGARFPDATEDINRNMDRGMLVMNYLGHGGPKGWAQERVLQLSDIQNWSNYDRMALLITATCTFTGYDEPKVESGGELAFLNPKGGAISLFSTTRAVIAQSNARLVSNVYDTLFTLIDGQKQTLGEVIQNSKNASAIDTLNSNARKFTLIGDPAIKLNFPELGIKTSHINGTPIEQFQDTLKALDKVTIRGYVTDPFGQMLNDYNGIVRPTVFDKESKLTTLSNDSSSPEKVYSLYKNTLFKGAATVTNGQFEYTFVVPKDINYAVGSGRISYYASNETLIDAGGYTNDVLIGGSSNNILSDNEGPDIQLYMNDESFVSGGNTNSEPTLLVQLEDINGINVTGTSIGHDLSGKFTTGNQDLFIMNDYYEAEVDNYQKGSARYPLSQLAPGKHIINVKAWDVLNNSSEAQIEFVVIDESGEGLQNVFNYPNPFTTNTKFMFEHNMAANELDVLVDIYTVSGKLIKSIEATSIVNGKRVDNIAWDGTDDYGEDIGKGVYLYKIKARSADLGQTQESDFQKLVILK